MANPEGRRSLRAWLGDIVGHTYREGGLRRLLVHGPRFVREELLGERLRWRLLVHPLRGRHLDREALRSRARETDTLWEGDQQESVTVEAATEATLPKPLLDSTGTYDPERPFVAEVQEARLLGERGIGMVDGEVVLETTNASKMYLYLALEELYDAIEAGRSTRNAYRSYRAVIQETSSIERPDSVDTDPPEIAAPMLTYWGSFYHWVLEYLPRLRMLERYESETGRRPTLLIRPDPKPWIRETLRLCGWGPEDCAEWVWPEAQIERLVVPMHRNQFVAPHDSHFHDDFNPAPEDARWVAQRLQSNVTSLDPGDGKLDADEFSPRVYVTRQDTRTRQIANERAVLDALEPLGFESYALSELSIPDQIRLFASAEAVVGPHGAGLVNLIHCEDAAVFELFQDDHVQPYYFSLARQLGFEYDCAVYPTRDDETVVDPEDLRERVAAFLDRSGLSDQS